MTSWRRDPRYRALSGFRKAVYELCAAVPAGRVTTYGAIAKALHVASSQAVGTALKNNPFAPRVPCHRVVKGGGTIGGFNGATEEGGSPEISRKFLLLASEGVVFDTRKRLADPADVIGAEDFEPSALAEALRLYTRQTPATDCEGSEPATAGGVTAGAKRSRGGAVRVGEPSVGGRRRTAGRGSTSSATAAPLLAPPHAALSTGVAVRAAARSGALRGHTSGLAPGFAQANLVFVPRASAFDFLLFCQRNPKPCPLLEVLDPGAWEARVSRTRKNGGGSGGGSSSVKWRVPQQAIP